MSKILKSILLGTALTAATATVSKAEGVELEVTHWWTSGGEAAAVGKFADAWNATATPGSMAQSPVPVAQRALSLFHASLAVTRWLPHSLTMAAKQKN